MKDTTKGNEQYDNLQSPERRSFIKTTGVKTAVVGGKNVYIAKDVQKIIDLGEICGKYRGGSMFGLSCVP